MEETLTFVFEKLKATVKISGGEAQAWFSRTIQPESISHWNLALRNSGTAAAAWLDRICPPETRSSVLLAVKSSGTAATAWLDHILPPETRARWLLAAKSSGTAAATCFQSGNAIRCRFFPGENLKNLFPRLFLPFRKGNPTQQASCRFVTGNIEYLALVDYIIDRDSAFGITVIVNSYKRSKKIVTKIVSLRSPHTLFPFPNE
ncbi:6-phosphogluconolactonase 5 [Striga asiatica]|uniref:6-phosphogluconolactonase 5 n=1 Tax=Striga asiatica TaxID=4170 RepID=A0A5A7QHC3_STRAF|nr:6-phosphogluconolactonase 5 [Striga asiatica]